MRQGRIINDTIVHGVYDAHINLRMGWHRILHTGNLVLSGALGDSDAREMNIAFCGIPVAPGTMGSAQFPFGFGTPEASMGTGNTDRE